MKSVLNIPLGRQIQLAVCVFVLLPATLAFGPMRELAQMGDLALRSVFRPAASIAPTQYPVVIDAGPTDPAALHALLRQMDDAASVTLVDPVTVANDSLAEAVRYNGATYVTDALDADGQPSAAIVRAAARGIAHGDVPASVSARHAGLRAWQLSGNTMRASAALMPLLPDERWRERTDSAYRQPDMRALPMRGLTPPVLNASAALTQTEPALAALVARRHVFIGGEDADRLETIARYHTGLATGQVLQQPEWSSMATWLIVTVGMFLLVSVLWRESRYIILVCASVCTAGLLVYQWTLANQFHLQVDVLVPLVSLMAGFATCFGLTPDRQSNRRENFRGGLRYLRNGKLDAAFRVFRHCPPHPSLMPTLYKLAIAFEKRSQPEQARAVFAYMAGQQDERHKSGATTSVQQRVVRSENIPESLGRYEVLRPLGSGAMGGVFLGRDPRINRLIALKIVSFDDHSDDAARVEARARFFQEAESAGRLTHPAITAVYDSGEEHDVAYIAMEYAPGVQLIQHTRPDALLDPVVVLRLATRVAEALDYAHSEHVVHRDIKPANLIYDASNESVKITDFGVARLVDDERTQTGLILGTPTYMSPEQTSGAPVTGSSDLFSLGVTLYELLTGEVPFRGKTVAELMTAINSKTPAPVTSLRPGLPPIIDTVLEKALSKQPENRYASGHDFAFALRECVSGMFGLAANQ